MITQTLKKILLAGTTFSFGMLPFTASAGDYTFASTGVNGANGYKIYLSPAIHNDGGSRGECNNLNENNIAFWNLYAAATDNTYAYSLTQRGYTVKLGDGELGELQQHVNSANNWGAHRYLVMHSNARAETCGATNVSGHGTWGIHHSGSTNGQALATAMVDWVGSASPGTADYTCLNNSPCTGNRTLYELRYTWAPAAYIEADFHTWSMGTDFLWNKINWQWYIAAAMDSHLNYPR